MSFYFCESKKAICITKSCTIGKELKELPCIEVPVESRIPCPGLPELGIPADPESKNPSIWAINEPQFHLQEAHFIFKDGTTGTWIGKLELLRGC